MKRTLLLIGILIALTIASLWLKHKGILFSGGFNSGNVEPVVKWNALLPGHWKYYLFEENSDYQRKDIGSLSIRKDNSFEFIYTTKLYQKNAGDAINIFFEGKYYNSVEYAINVKLTGKWMIKDLKLLLVSSHHEIKYTKASSKYDLSEDFLHSDTLSFGDHISNGRDMHIQQFNKRKIVFEIEDYTLDSRKHLRFEKVGN